VSIAWRLDTPDPDRDRRRPEGCRVAAVDLKGLKSVAIAVRTRLACLQASQTVRRAPAPRSRARLAATAALAFYAVSSP